LDTFPDDVRKFLDANIDSMEQLETLRVLSEDETREWSDVEIARQIQSSVEVTVLHLNALSARGMLKSFQRDEFTVFQYGPGSPELQTQVGRLLELYKQRPVTMIRMVYERPRSALRDFSNAFKFRKED
jgi:hypothetical protein